MTTKTQEVVAVNEGATYKANNGGKLVVAFYVDRPRSTVFFSTVGSAREDYVSIDDFLRDYTLVAEKGEPIPEQK